MDYFDSIRIRALASVMSPDTDDFLDDVFEWYSQTYHTPLHVVKEDLALDDVMCAYFKSIYKAMNPEDRHNTAIWLLETPEERQARTKEDKADDDDFMRKANASNAKKKPSKADEAFKKMQERFKQDLGDGLKPPVAKMPDRKLPVNMSAFKEMKETTLPDSVTGEEVVVKYMSEKDFEAMLDRDVGPQPKPRKR